MGWRGHGVRVERGTVFVVIKYLTDERLKFIYLNVYKHFMNVDEASNCSINHLSKDWKLGYLIGMLLTDGNLNKINEKKKDYLIRIYDNSYPFLVKVREIVKEFTNKEPKIVYDRKNNHYTLYIRDKNLWVFLIKLGVPSGKKSKEMRVPQIIMSSSYSNQERLERVKGFLSALIDAEGYVRIQKDRDHPNGYPRIDIKMVASKFLEDCKRLFDELEISCKIYHYNTFSILTLLGKKNINLVFENLKLLKKTVPPTETGQGVWGSGEPKRPSPRRRSESDSPQ